MSKISKEGYDQIQVIKNALDSMYDKLNADFYVKNSDKKKVRDVEKMFSKTNAFEPVKSEFEAIAGIIELTSTWEEV
jgi:Skp family chaperone for outer membrane proteins